MLTIKRVYEPRAESDGTRVLVDRLWPRGLTKEHAHIDMWLKEIAPTTELRQWFNHDPDKWEEFQVRYTGELKDNQAALAPIKQALAAGAVTLVYGAKDESCNQAVVLRDYLEKYTDEKNIFAIGTESKQKIGYVEEVLRELGIYAEIVPNKAASGVSNQPMTSDETLAGATNRAEAALKAIPHAERGIGIEVGYDRLASGAYKMFCWTVVVRRNGRIAKARSHSFLLPGFHQEVLNSGRYLGDHVREYFAVASDPITQYVAEVVRGRKLFITESLRYALIYSLHEEFYSVNT